MHDIRARAEVLARQVLERRWAPERFRLELEGERVRRQRALLRPLYVASFQVWERAEVALVDDAQVRYPMPREEPSPPEVAAPEEVRAAALAAANALRPGEGHEVELVRRGPAGPYHVELRRLPPDGRLTVELDPRDGAWVGYCCLPLYRGSSRCAALGRSGAVSRARAALELPPRARLVYTRLEQRPLGRLWSLRWEVREGPARGHIHVDLNARTGAVCRLTRSLEQVPTLAGERDARQEAEHALQLEVAVRLGDGACLGPLVPGAVTRRGRARPAWLAVVLLRGAVYRATLCDGRVRLERPRRAG